MNLVLHSVKHGLSNILRFSGRDTREQFWPYALLVFTPTTVAMVAIVLNMTAGFWSQFGAIVLRLITSIDRHVYLGSEVRAIHSFFYRTAASSPEYELLISIVMGIAALFLAAAIVRRLRDAGKSEYWATLPVPFFVIGMIATMLMFNHADGGQSEIELPISVAHFISLIALTILLLIGSLGYLAVLLAGDSIRKRSGPWSGV